MSSLAKLFSEYQDKKFVFIKSKGNYGDQMIYAGAEKLAHENGIDFKTIDYNTPIDSDTVIYLHGGGGYNSWWGWSGVLFSTIRKKYPNNTMIIGPSTTSQELDYLKQTLPPDDEKIFFFARERTTYKFIKENFYFQIFLDDDTALQLEKDDPAFKRFIRNTAIKEEHTLLAVRNDAESSDIPQVILNGIYDIRCDPTKLEPTLMRKVFSYLGIVSKKWIKVHLWAKMITTNRSHSAILGAVAGKRVELFGNSYHKNKSIWEYSLKKRGVKWIE